jgi:hypothetical protein
MDRSRFLPGHAGTPEIREAVRSQIVAYGRTASLDIAQELEVPHATVVRVLQRFAAVGGLRLLPSLTRSGAVVVAPGSLTTRFRDLSVPLW